MFTLHAFFECDTLVPEHPPALRNMEAEAEKTASPSRARTSLARKESLGGGVGGRKGG